LPYFFNGVLNIFLIALVIASIAYSFWASLVADKNTKSAMETAQ